jgi:hypothetical protein
MSMARSKCFRTDCLADPIFIVSLLPSALSECSSFCPLRLSLRNIESQKLELSLTND